MSAVAPLKRLVRIADALESGTPVAADDARRLVESIRRYQSGSAIDDALGLRLHPGERDPRSRLALERRDALLHETAQRFCSGLSTAAAANRLHVTMNAIFRECVATRAQP
jgi:hypothetical protein